MTRSRLIGAAVAALSAVAATSGVAAAQHVATASGTKRVIVHFPVNGPGGQDSHTCFWGVAYTQETRNIIWPDSHTDYPVSTDTIPAGGKIVLHGRFPHARFFSLTTSSVLGQLRGHLYDATIKPDPGSTNPFLPGANRNAKHRSYTVTVLDQPDPGPGHEAPNTLYAASPARRRAPVRCARRARLSPRPGSRLLRWRRRAGRQLRRADGTTSTGQAACAALETKPGAANLINVNPILFPERRSSRCSRSARRPNIPPSNPAWYKYFGPSWLLAPTTPAPRTRA